MLPQCILIHRQYHSPDLFIPTTFTSHVNHYASYFAHLSNPPPPTQISSFHQILITFLSNLPSNPINILSLVSEARCLIHTKQRVKQWRNMKNLLIMEPNCVLVLHSKVQPERKWSWNVKIITILDVTSCVLFIIPIFGGNRWLCTRSKEVYSRAKMMAKVYFQKYIWWVPKK